MSGGHFEYYNDRACDSVFGWGVRADYGMGDEEYAGNVKKARKIDPMKDKLISELVFDVFCLLHSADWCLSGDTGEETYQKDIDYFKQKWLKTDITEAEINKVLEEAREELMKSLLGG